MSSSEEVSIFDKSIDVNFEQPKNIKFISLTKEVFIFPKFTFSRFEQP